MKFHRVYVEITNICGLACSFCPAKTLPPQTMSLDFFEDIVSQLSLYTKELALHVVGDPLVLSNLDEYLDIANKFEMKISLTTSGYFLGKKEPTLLLHQSIKQVNISLNSYNKNSMPISFEEYMSPILGLCDLKLETNPNSFINLRVWNLDEEQSEKSFNQTLFKKLQEHFNTPLHVENIYKEKPKNIRLASKILLHFDNYFEWPSLETKNMSHGTCQGLHSHFGILANGDVVPCCLDKDGVMKLGNLHVQSLKSILQSKRVREIRDGFKNGFAIELLCQKCTYKERFNELL
ncbi:MAG: SPASM domain-containing protein [Sulfurospirillaceae bacterium]|nr:SPASM domain-containing protein [Sulfurospirillaceae bacterium]